MDVNFAKGLEAWAVAEGLTVDTTGHVEARILRALRALAAVAGQGGFVAFNNEVLTLLASIAASAGSGGDADSVGGFTPGAAGGDLLQAVTQSEARGDKLGFTSVGEALVTAVDAAAARSAIGVGSIATQAASAVALTGGTSTGVANGARTTSSGTDTIVLGDVGGAVVYGASCTIAITAALPTGSQVRVAGSATATLTWSVSGGETISEATTALTAGQGRLLIKESASAWRVVQSGAVGAVRIHGYISGGVWYAVAQQYNGTAWVDVGSPVAATSGGAGGLTSLSGSTWTLTSGATATAKPDPTTVGAQGRVWYWALSSFALPTITDGATVAMLLRVGTRPTAAYATWSVTCLSGAWSTSSQTMVGAALSYQTNKTIGTIWGGNNWGLATNNANFDEVWVNYNYKLGTGTASYRTTNRATLGNLSTALSVPTSTMTHIGTSLQATSLTTVADASFVSPEFWLWWVDA